MRYRLKITAAATEDMEDAAIWYENQRSGLGQTFLIAMKKAFDVIRSNPERYPFADEGKMRKRYLLPSPFRSYMIIYFIEDDLITVNAVFHTSRDPNVWQSRG